jgi:hypothetical protein
MGRFADQDDRHEWPRAMENLTFECKARLQQAAANLSIASPKIPFSEMQTAGSRFLFRPYLVIAQLPHENFLVYGLSGVVEHRRDASRAANF